MSKENEPITEKLRVEYISDSVEVSTSKSVDLDVKKLLGGVADNGWITSDDGSIFLQLNSVSAGKIPLEKGDTMNFDREDKWVISRVIITTASAVSLTVRYFLKKKV